MSQLFCLFFKHKQELLPFITEGLDTDDDEVLLALAPAIGRCLPIVGDAVILLPPLEPLLQVEDPAVRDAALVAVELVVGSLSESDFQTHYMPLLRRLAESEWFTARLAAARLLAGAHGKITDAQQRHDVVSNLFCGQLCRDETHLVRRGAAQSLGTMLESVVNTEGRRELQAQGLVITTLLPLYETLAAVEQPDSVRLQTAANCVALGRVLTNCLNDTSTPQLNDAEKSILQRVLPLVVATIDDRSWRVRWTAAAKFADLVQAYDRLPGAMDALVPAYEKLLQDPEAEVRTAATLNLAPVARSPARVLQTDGADPSSSRVSVAERLVQRVTGLTEDDSEHVRAALARVATELAPVLGRGATIMYLVPPVLLLLRDAASEVRLNLISSLSALNEVIGVDLLSQSLLPAILDLAQDGKWRIRLAIIENVPLLARQLGRDFFTEKLSSLCVDWLGDDIASIRKAAATNLKELAALFGTEWAIQNLVPVVDEFLRNDSYLRRLTALQALSMMSLQMDSATARVNVLPKVLDMANDMVANIRFNVAKQLQYLAPHFGAACFETQVLPILTMLMDDEDRDVRFHAEQAVRALEGKVLPLEGK